MVVIHLLVFFNFQLASSISPILSEFITAAVHYENNHSMERQILTGVDANHSFKNCTWTF
jgi:hypothetical protein